LNILYSCKCDHLSMHS